MAADVGSLTPSQAAAVDDAGTPAHVLVVTTKPSFRVRQQKSGYTGEKSYIVVLMQGGHASRVSVHAVVTRQTAQASADDLNDAEARHAANLADPAWVAERDRIQAEQEAAEQARSDAFARLIAAQAARREANTARPTTAVASTRVQAPVGSVRPSPNPA